ncbi:MAG TPA: hypothetical protein VGO47_12145 [Chlamydiales bacterium]|jgi:hypothetical protein|nr:hypothetical protein [Chlamydiales bacterium]
MASDTADNILWTHYTHKGTIEGHAPYLREILRRLKFADLQTPLPLRAVIQQSSKEVKDSTGTSFLMVTGRSRRLAAESHQVELSSIVAERNDASISNDVTKTVGEVATAVMAAGINVNGLLVIQAANASSV